MSKISNAKECDGKSNVPGRTNYNFCGYFATILKQNTTLCKLLDLTVILELNLAIRNEATGSDVCRSR